jgi:glycosidase
MRHKGFSRLAIFDVTFALGFSRILKVLCRKVFLSILLALPALCLLNAQDSGVDKIEPPSWWAGSAWTPIRLLVHGRNLSQAKVTAAEPLAIGNLKTNQRGTYLFADLTISPSAHPGKHALHFVFADGKTQDVAFELLPPPSGSTRGQGFHSDDFIYLIMPDRFANGDTSNDDPAVSKGLFDRHNPRYYHGGDLQGILDHAGYLKDLGVTAVWLNPWYDNNNHLNEKERYDNKPMADYHGYGAVDYYGVEEHFGSFDLLREMVRTLQSEGIKVIQDQVANHVGPYHPWTQDPPTPTWFNGTPEQHVADTWQVWTLMDPHGTAATRHETLDGWFIDILPDMNQGDPEARRYLIQNALWWAGVTGLDAIRQDTMPYVPRDFWHDWAAALRKEFPRLRVVGEVFDGDPALVSFFQGGRRGNDGIDTGFHSVFDFPLYFALRSAFARNGDIRDVPKVLAHDFLYPSPGMLVTFLGNHDVERFISEKGATPEGLMMAFTALFTLRGVPMVYYGDELAMAGGNDPDNRRDFPGGWKEDSRNAFTEAGRTAVENSVFHHVRKLAALRKQYPALANGRMTNLYTSEKQWVFARSVLGTTLIVGFNLGNQAAQVEIDTQGLSLADGAVLKGVLGAASATVSNGHLKLELPARRSLILAQ